MNLSAKAAKTAARYYGATAREYDARRSGQPKWDGENRAIRAGLADMPAGSRVLDVPCGTGRFFPFYLERQFAVHAIDVSADMVAVARPRAAAAIACAVGSIYALALEDQAVDAAVCCRFANLIEAGDLSVALGELQRVTRRRILMTLRTAQRNPSGHYHSAHDLAVVEQALRPGWRLASADPIHERDYRLVRLERA